MRVTVTEPDYTLSFTLNEASKTFIGYEDVDTPDHIHYIDFKGSYTQDGDAYRLTEAKKIMPITYVIEVDRAEGTATVKLPMSCGPQLIGRGRVEP